MRFPIRFYILDAVTGWGIIPALKEISACQSDNNKIIEISNERAIRLEQAAVESGLSVCNKVDGDEYTDKNDYLNNSRVNQNCKKFITKKTGGSTGQPLSYRVNLAAQGFLWAGIIRAWEEVGYQYGQRVAFIGGSSVLTLSPKKRVLYKLLNVLPLSSFGMSDDVLHDYVINIINGNIKFIYGYSNAILMLANFVNDKGISLKLTGVICTAERLEDSALEYLSETFSATVIRQYGVNDGGISAFECKYHEGYHVIANRAKVEIVDDELLSTDLVNSAQFFIRYKVGDKGKLENGICKCGLHYPRIRELKGRSNDLIKDPDGVIYHSEFFTHYFRNYSEILQWQVVAEGKNLSIILSVVDDIFDDTEFEQNVINYFKSATSFKIINVDSTGNFLRLQNGKIKFVMQI